MFRIITTKGTEVGITESVRYIKISEHNGCFIRCMQKDAIGVAFNSKPYNLEGHSDIPDAETVRVIEIDLGPELDYLKTQSNIVAEQLMEVDEIAIQLYEANLALDKATAEQDEAIIQIYEMMGEITNG